MLFSFLARNESDGMVVLPFCQLYYMTVVVRLDDDAAGRQTDSQTDRRTLRVH